MSVTIINADCRDALKDMANESVHYIVTSPPYWGLRDYGIPPSVWGGEAGCAHEWAEWSERHDVRAETISGKSRTTQAFYGEPSRKFNGNHQRHTAGQFCQRCGAWCGCLGLEPDFRMWVAHLTEIFRECRRVLAKDGTLWLNLGDAYVGGGRGGNPAESAHRKQATNVGSLIKRSSIPAGLKPKNLIGLPWHVAFALQEDGWWLRQDIIWHKPNCMPESVRDRPTRAHDYVFLFAKSARYYCNRDALMEPATDTGRINGRGGRNEDARARPPGSNPRTLKRLDYSARGRNARSVWTIATEPTRYAHFAAFPVELARRCIAAGCPEGGTVLDPFAGTGTVGVAADRLGRNAVLIEIKAADCAHIEERLACDRLKRGQGTMGDVSAAKLEPTPFEALIDQAQHDGSPLA